MRPRDGGRGEPQHASCGNPSASIPGPHPLHGCKWPLAAMVSQ
jgi:hypothetical protein